MRWPFLLSLLVLTAACSSSASRPSADWRSTLSEGEAFVEAGRYDDAATRFSAGLAAGGGESAALVANRAALARLAIRRGRFPEALSNMSATGAAGARAPEVLLARGEYFLALGRYAAARSVLAPALAAPATRSAAALAFARLALAEGGYQDLEKHLVGVTNGEALILRGEAALAAGRPDAAAGFFAGAEKDLASVPAGPGAAALWRGRLRLALRVGDPAAAREALERARSLENALADGATPGNLETALLEARLALLLGPPATALVSVGETRRALSEAYGPAHPESVAATLLFARAQAEAGNAGAGIAPADEVLALPEGTLAPAHPLRREAIAVRGLLALHGGKAGEAERLFRRARELQVASHPAGHPAPVAADNDLALALRALGRPAEAERLLVAAAGFYSNDGNFPLDGATVTHNLALLRLEGGRPAAALPALEGALAARRRLLGDGHADTASSFFLQGRILHRLGRLEAAEGGLRAALATRTALFGGDRPATAAVADALGLVLSARGKKEEARALFGQAAAAYEKAGMRAAAATVRARLPR